MSPLPTHPPFFLLLCCSTAQPCATHELHISYFGNPDSKLSHFYNQIYILIILNTTIQHKRKYRVYALLNNQHTLNDGFFRCFSERTTSKSVKWKGEAREKGEKGKKGERREREGREGREGRERENIRKMTKE